MRIEPSRCPDCGRVAQGFEEIVPVKAFVELCEESGEYQYTGESKVYWDSQVLDLNDEGVGVAHCQEGHTWEFTLEEEVTGAPTA